MPPDAGEPSDRVGLVPLAAVFLRLGLTSFGGPAAHVALMRDEFVRRRRWLDDGAYVDLIGAANLIPGPTSTEVAMHVGHRRAGLPGLVVAGLAFLLPAVLIVAALAWLYVEQGTRPEVGAILAGVAPVVVAIIAVAGASIGRTALRTPVALALAGLTVAGAVAGLSEVLLLLGSGALGVAAAEARRGMASAAVGGWVASTPITATVALATVVAVPAAAIFAEFLKIGAVLFGSGYVLVALLRSELVDGLGWITETQLLDAVAVGQATPGPLFSTATFIGYLVGGPIGAVAATFGIFLPAFIAVALSIPILDRLRRSVRARAFLDGVNASAVGLLGVVAVQLAEGSLRDVLGLATAVVAAALLWRGVGTGWLVAGGAVVGLSRLVLPSG